MEVVGPTHGPGADEVCVAGKDGKNLRATPRRRKQARDEGQVAKSQELAVAVSLVVAVLAMRTIAPATWRLITERTEEMLIATSSTEIPAQLIADGSLQIFIAGVVPFLLVAMFSGTVASVAQVGLKVTPKALKPKLSKISPKEGIKKFKLSNAGWELARTAIKIGLLIAVVWEPVAGLMETISVAADINEAMIATADVSLLILFRAAALMAVIAGADYAVNKYKHEQQLKMSREDIKQESKQSEGSPEIKARRRRKQFEFSYNRMMAAVGTADVVVTNPTHFAVALNYTETNGAPVVVAKGVDAMALKIRHEAYRNGVTVMENPPLARALYRRVKIGKSIPTDLYEAVAVVLAVVYRRRARARRSSVADVLNRNAPSAAAKVVA